MELSKKQKKELLEGILLDLAKSLYLERLKEKAAHKLSITQGDAKMGQAHEAVKKNIEALEGQERFYTNALNEL